MNKNLAIIGSGDLGQLIAYHAQANCGFNVVGFFDDYKTKDELVDGHKILGNLSEIETLFNVNIFNCIIIAIGYKHMHARASIFDKFTNIINFAKVIHPSCIIDKSCTIGEGSFLLPGCVLDRNVTLGNNVLLNTACVIAHDTSIGAHSFLSPAVKIAGFTTVEEQCILGINCTIIDNLIIVKATQVGGGAVVVNSITEPGLYVGCPAKKIK
jgi:sugar O-acyltransferase (sialic acid O-acetyltransferase NeuD family)